MAAAARAKGSTPRGGRKPAAPPSSSSAPFGLKRWQLLLAVGVFVVVAYIIWRRSKSGAQTAADTTAQPATTDQSGAFDGSGAVSGQPQPNTPPNEVTNNYYYGSQANPTSPAATGGNRYNFPIPDTWPGSSGAGSGMSLITSAFGGGGFSYDLPTGTPTDTSTLGSIVTTFGVPASPPAAGTIRPHYTGGGTAVAS